MLRYPQWCIPILIAGLWSCDRHHNPSPTVVARSSKPVIFDAGDVSLQAGAQTIHHKFRAHWRSEQPVELRVKTSCGCLKASLDRHQLHKDETCELDVSMEISTLGRRAETAWLIGSDGNTHQFILTANGVTAQGFYTFLRSPHVNSKGLAEVRVYLLDSIGHGDASPPKLISPETISIKNASWFTLEHADDQRLRPHRQVGTIVLDLSQFQGSFPVDVTFQTSRGQSSRVRIDQPTS